MKKLLVLGGNYIECDLIKEAQSLGYYVIVTDNHEDWNLSPGKKIADEAWNISWSDLESLKLKCIEEKVAGIVAGFSEFRVENMIKLCKFFNFPCSLNLEQLEITRNKLLFKAVCRESDIPTIKEYSILDKIEYPVIIKPVDRAGSIGINVANNSEELKTFYEYALSLSPSKQVIIEDYITEGIKFDIYYYIEDSEAIFLGSSDTVMCVGEYGNKFLQKAWTFPSIYEKEFMEKYDKKIQGMFRKMDIRNCYVTLSAFYINSNFYFFEAGFRLSGELSYNYYKSVSGYNYLDKFISFAAGEKSIFPKNKNKRMYSIILNYFGVNGCVTSIKDDIINEYKEVIAYNLYVKEGDYINNTTKNLKKIAMLTIASPNISELLYIVQQLNINFDILSEDGHSLIYERCSVNDFDTFVNYYKLI